MKFEEWKRLITSSEPSDRSEAADNLPDSGDSEEIMRGLLSCVSDPNALVRTCAIDSLSLFPSDQVRVTLRKQLDQETDELAKAYIFSSLADTGTLQDLQIIADALRTEESKIIRAHAALGVLIVTMRVCREEFVTLCNDGDLNIRGKAFSLLSEAVGLMLDALADFKSVAVAHRSNEAGTTFEHIENILASLSAQGFPGPGSERKKT